MARFKSFTAWCEQGTTTAYDPNATVDYTPNQALQSTGNNRNASTSVDPNRTVDYRPGGGQPGVIDPDVAAAAEGLHTIHTQLRDIFGKVRSKMQAFRYPKMKDAFERELMAGVDGVGRAHAIILPSARGADEHE